jgi:hypothetical protein
LVVSDQTTTPHELIRKRAASEHSLNRLPCGQIRKTLLHVARSHEPIALTPMEYPAHR